MEKELSLEFLRVVETAAIESARTMGQGDRSGSDHAAVEAMRKEMDRVGMDGTIVIGEGERDEAPMLFIGEKVGAAVRDKSRTYPQVDIAVDPLKEPTCAPQVNPARSWCSPPVSMVACFMRRTCTWKKLSSGRPPRAPSISMLRRKTTYERLPGVTTATSKIWSSSSSIGRATSNSSADIRAAGARIRLISDGDLSAGIAAAVRGTAVHAVMGTGGAPEGVLTAAALRCLNGRDTRAFGGR